MSAYTIGVDIGTTGTKAVLLEVGHGVVASATAETTLFSGKAGFAEADTSQWLSNVHYTVRELLHSGHCAPEDIVGISTTGMVPAVVLVDSHGNALHRALLQNDARAVTEIDELAAELEGLDFVGDTGSPLSQQSVAPTARWFQANLPHVWAESHYVVGSYDFVLMALGAAAHVERNWALESGLFHISGQPHEQIIKSAGVAFEQLPGIASAGQVVGQLTPAHAEAMGLPEGIPLVAGGADHVLSAYGAGVSQEGDWLVKLGGAGDILVATAEPLVDRRLYLDAHPIDGVWLPNGCMATSGSLIRWFQGITKIDDLGAMDELAAAVDPATVLCLPYFLGEKSPLHDPNLRGAFFGMHLGTTREQMYRAVLEAIAYGFRHHVDVLRERGVAVQRAMVTNGGSKSTLWKQIHADILGVPLHPVVDHPGASLGAAVIAGVGAGAIESLASIDDYVSLGPTVTPQPGNVEIYDRAYEEWRDLADTTTHLAHRLSGRTRV